jgi:hypothetical protein
MKRSTTVRMGAFGAVCALAGGAAGIAGSSASSRRSTRPTTAAGAVAERRGPPGWLGPLAGLAGPPVHADAVVPNDKGGFDAVTMDRGKFASLSGDQLTITEGTKTATYKTVTLTIPPSASVRRNDEAAKLSDLKTGDAVLIAQSPQGTVVAADDAQHAERLHHEFRGPALGELPRRPPQLPAIPDEGSSHRSGEGAAGGGSS